MKDFVNLFNEIDATTKTNEKVEAIVQYFNNATSIDKLWTLALFSGRNPKRIVKTTQLKEWAAETANIPFWLFEESYHIVGDLSETIANILPDYENSSNLTLAEWMILLKQKIKDSEENKKEFMLKAWQSFSKEERFVFNKLTSGAFRMGVSQKLVIKALSKHTGLSENKIAHRLMGNWQPENTTYEDLLFNENTNDESSKPYPFYLAYALEGEPLHLGHIEDWQIEHKWDGIRAQLIVRNNELFIWSRGEELVTTQYPELAIATSLLPNGTVLDGELLPYKNNHPLSFNEMQTRISRKNISVKLMQQTPIVLCAYDILEWNGIDIRNQPLNERRNILEKLIANIQVTNPNCPFILSQSVEASSWETVVAERNKSREMGSEGLMLKRKKSTYEVGRKKGDWWKWKVDPMTVDAVLIYAQSGSGRRANLFTDYTFAVWNNEGILVPFAKAYSGLTDKEITEVDAWIKKNTVEKFGPVRSVNAELVFELGFEGINKSSRHKSGIAVRFPRIMRWRKDKPASEADTLATLQQLILP